MMTKDKKPFTYTPGMGGKLDLSQIRSPRMARRVAKNANDEGIEGPPKSALAQQSPQHQPTGIYTQPQVAVPVLPQGMPQQPAINLRNSTLPRSLSGGGIIVPIIERQTDSVPRPTVKVETKIQPVANSPDTPTPPTSPTQVTLSKAPTPWMQKQVKQQEELPEWAKRTSGNRTQDEQSSGSSSPLHQDSPTAPRQIIIVNTPKQQTQQQPYQQNPQQYQQQPQQYQQQPQQYQQQQQMRPVRQDNNERIIPLRVEDRPSVFTAMNESGHHQLMNSAPHHQSRWGNPVGQSGYQQPQGGTHIIPIQFDGQQQYQMPNTVSSPTTVNNNQIQYRSIPVDNQSNRNMQRGHVPISNQQGEPGPVQSKSFRVLQKITDTDPDQIDEEHLRKLQLTEDDRYLMNKFKEQDEVSIPVTAYVPASEQQVPEPKKYMGGAIPSRSFKILQAMTAPESITTQVTQENRQHSATDFINMPDNQQGVYYSAYSHLIPPASPFVFWNPETGWWAYCPIPPYANYKFFHYPYHYYHYHSQDYSTDGITYIHLDNPMTMAHFSLDNDSRVSELNDNNSDECIAAFYGNPFSRNSDLYAGSQWRYNLSATPTSCTTTTMELNDKYTEEPPLTSYSPLSSLSSKDGCESEEEREDDCCSKRSNGEEENTSTKSSDCSSDSESYIAYSTGLNPLNEKFNATSKENVKDESREKHKEETDLTDCEKEALLEDDREFEKEVGEDEEEEEEDDVQNENTEPSVDESIGNTTVSVSLPLRLRFSLSEKNEDVTTVIVGNSTIAKNVETCVDFTLKKFNNPERNKEEISAERTQINPTFIVTTTDEDQPEVNNPSDTATLPNMNTEDKRKTMLSVRNHSKEEVTDDDDSGVTSDVSRIISEVDTDSEYCITTTKATTTETADKSSVSKRSSGNKKYYRTQTHSRLFKLLNDEQLLGSSLSSYEENSSNSSGLTSPDCNHVDESILRTARHQLPTRPKSLDCESLFRRQKGRQQDSYYQTWKNGECNSRKSSAGAAQWTHPRVNVLCPRIKSTKNVPQASKNSQQLSRMKSPLGSSTISSSFPSPVGTSKRC